MRHGFARRFASNGGAVGGLAVLILIALAAIAAPWIFPGDPWAIRGPAMVAPNGRFPMGTDMLGRNVIAEIFYGGRVTLTIGLVSTACATTIGVLLGAISGYAGAGIDEALMRLTEFVQTIPSFVLAILLVAIMGPSIHATIIAVAVVTWPPVARVVRAEFLTIRRREYVEAAFTIGLPPWRVMLFEILPNAASPVVVMASLMVAIAILTASSLSFLGLGDPNLISWGYMIGASRAVFLSAWWLSIFPGIAIFLTVLAINVVGEGLNDALNPHTRQVAWPQ